MTLNKADTNVKFSPSQAAALDYQHRGFTVTPAHTGKCPRRKDWMKWPVATDWQDSQPYASDKDLLKAFKGNRNISMLMGTPLKTGFTGALDTDVIKARQLINAGYDIAANAGPEEVHAFCEKHQIPYHHGEENIRRLREKLGGVAFTKTFSQRTMSGGIHRVYVFPEDALPVNGTNIGKDWERLYGIEFVLPGESGVDFRGAGGQIIVAPSVYGGRPYELLYDRDPAKAPAWLVTLLQKPVKVAKKDLRTPEKPGNSKKTKGSVDTSEEVNLANRLKSVSAALGSDKTFRELEDTLLRKKPLSEALCPSGYDSWVRVGMALHGSYAGTDLEEQAFDLWCDFSAKAPNASDMDELVYKWESFGKKGGNLEGLKINTIFHFAKEAGWTPEAAARKHLAKKAAKITAENAEGFVAEIAAASAGKKGLRYADVKMVVHKVAEVTGDSVSEVKRKVRDLKKDIQKDIFESTYGGDIQWPDWSKTDMPDPNSLANIQAWLAHRRLSVSLNTFCNKIIVHNVDTHPGDIPDGDFKDAVFDDVKLQRMRREMHLDGFRVGKDFLFEMLAGEAASRQYSCVVHLLDSLVWDGKKRLYNALVTYTSAADTQLNKEIFYRTVIGQVARAYEPGCKHDTIAVFEGKQGIRKSTFARLMCLRNRYFTDSLEMGADSKLMIEGTQGKWVVEFGEMAKARGRDREHIIKMLSAQSDVARLAYGRMTSDVDRGFIFIGSTNERGYLTDIAKGTRRFLPLWLGDDLIDVEGFEEDRWQIYAEAVHLYKRGMSWELPQSLWEAAGKAQAARSETDVLDDEVQDIISDREGYVLRLEMYKKIWPEKSARDPWQTRKLDAAMARIGFEVKRMRINKGVPLTYYVKGDRKPLFGEDQ